MSKPFPFIIGVFLVLSAVGCQQQFAKTSADAPDHTTSGTVNAPTQETAQNTQNDATSETRRNQLNSDIRAREQRGNMADGGVSKSDADVKSEVRDKIEANLPASQLTVDAKDGAVTVAGTVPTQEQLNKVNQLAQEIKGVESVTVNVKVAPATAAPKK